MACRIDYLANHPQYTQEIADLKKAHWGVQAPRPDNIWLSEVIETATFEPPLTLVAVQPPDLLGFVILVNLDECAGIRDAIWLVALYVKADYRCQGIGAALVTRCCDEARRRGYDAIFLWAESQHLTDYYTKLGWSVVGKFYQTDEDVMKYSLEERT